MAEKAVPHGKYTIHPDKARFKFGVDRRTIFRWIAKGYLRSSGGLLDENQMDKKLEIWNSTIARQKARDILQVDPRTITSWVKAGILKSKNVFGKDGRITKESVDRVLLMPSYSPGSKKVLFASGFNPKKPFASEEREKNVKTMRKAKKAKGKQPKAFRLKIYVAQNQDEKKEIGTKKLVTAEDASRFLGVAQSQLGRERIHDFYMSDGRIMYFLNSVEIRGIKR